MEFFRSRVSEKLKAMGVPALIVVLGLAVLFLLFLILMKTEYFNLASVDVRGLRVLRVDDVKSLVSPYMGKSIFSDEMFVLEKKIEDITWVKKATLKPHLPDKLEITIVEREPLALINTRDDAVFRIFSVDKDGFLISEGDKLLVPGLPVITGLEIKNLYIGETINFNELAFLLGLLEKLQSTNRMMFEALNEINLNSMFGLIHYTFYMTDWNIPFETDVPDLVFFERVRMLLEHESPVVIKRVSAISNLLFVEEKKETTGS